MGKTSKTEPEIKVLEANMHYTIIWTSVLSLSSDFITLLTVNF